MKYQVTTHHPDRGLVGFSVGKATAREARQKLTDAVEYVSQAAERHGTDVIVQAGFGRRPNDRWYVGGPDVLAEICEKEGLR